MNKVWYNLGCLIVSLELVKNSDIIFDGRQISKKDTISTFNFFAILYRYLN